MIAEASQHEADGCELQECQRVVGEVLKIFGQPTATIEPRQGPLDHPAHWQHFEPFGLIRSFHDLHRELRQALRHSVDKLRSLITRVGKQLEQKRIHPEKSGEQQHTAVPVLDIRRMHDGVQQQA